MTNRLLLGLAATGLLFGALTVACSDDDSANNPGTTPGTGNDGGTVDATTGGDAGCTFAGYVIGLIDSQTNATAAPASDLGDSCTPSASQADFKSLFP